MEIKNKKITFIWNSPPTAADAAIEKLRQTRLKRQISLHAVLISYLLFISSWSNWINATISYSWFLKYFNFGTLLCVSLFVLVYIFFFLVVCLGNSNKPRNYSQLQRTCENFLKKLTWSRGIFWVISSEIHGKYPRHRQTGCGSCYLSDKYVIFQVHSLFAD